MNKIEKAVSYAESIANDNTHGYDQVSRWGNPDYDCSTLVITSCEKSGILLKTYGATFTGNLPSACETAGFKNVISKCNLANGYNLMRGDILLARGKHVVFYCGGGKVVGARLNEKGTIKNGKKGDQTGKEISIHPYYNYPWTHIYRYEASQLASNIIIKVAKDVIAGKYGNGLARQQLLESHGYDYKQIQNMVNTLLK